ncbi:hypothetical protein [Flammeovirga agarivorans]|uniref:Uncharacterized protein n=1 Tax=Flammeovirga agarivorans TaxID=2726742 RepID=A0A7X8XZ59_9BACT|nr:hypothetical protein [Flammeovirga agarivorans]NLR94847.1 hypothetical protein [Flammeovirga agarivorans]
MSAKAYTKTDQVIRTVFQAHPHIFLAEDLNREIENIKTPLYDYYKGLGILVSEGSIVYNNGELSFNSAKLWVQGVYIALAEDSNISVGSDDVYISLEVTRFNFESEAYKNVADPRELTGVNLPDVGYKKTCEVDVATSVTVGVGELPSGAFGTYLIKDRKPCFHSLEELSLFAKVNDLHTNLSSVNSEVSSIENRVKTNELNISDLTDISSSLSDRLKTAEDKNTSQDSAIGSAVDRVSSLERYAETLTEHINSLEETSVKKSDIPDAGGKLVTSVAGKVVATDFSISHTGSLSTNSTRIPTSRLVSEKIDEVYNSLNSNKLNKSAIGKNWSFMGTDASGNPKNSGYSPSSYIGSSSRSTDLATASGVWSAIANNKIVDSNWTSFSNSAVLSNATVDLTGLKYRKYGIFILLRGRIKVSGNFLQPLVAGEALFKIPGGSSDVLGKVVLPGTSVGDSSGSYSTTLEVDGAPLVSNHHNALYRYKNTIYSRLNVVPTKYIYVETILIV